MTKNQSNAKYCPSQSGDTTAIVSQEHYTRKTLNRGSRWYLYQPNPTENLKKSKKGDCVIRALCALENKEWRDVFDDLVVIARKQCDMPNADKVTGEYLRKLGYQRMSCGVLKGKTRPTVNSFAEQHPKGKFFLRVAHHVVAVVDGKFYDSWDSGMRSVYSYYAKHED